MPALSVYLFTFSLMICVFFASYASHAAETDFVKKRISGCSGELGGEEYLRRPIRLRVSPVDHDRITDLFLSESVSEDEKPQKAFEVYVESVLRKSGKKDRETILLSLAKMEDRPLKAGEELVTMGDKVILPPRTFKTVARWGIKAHEFRHQVQIVEWKNAFSRLLNGDKKVHEALEFDSVVGEWEFWNPIPARHRELAILEVTDEMPDSHKRQILLLALREAGRPLNEFLKLMQSAGRPGLRNWRPDSSIGYE
jgi:hypothetical protein